jgi:hypothetical protein
MVFSSLKHGIIMLNNELLFLYFTKLIKNYNKKILLKIKLTFF